MKRSRFVRPEVKVIELSNTDTITVKRKLNHGETVDARARMFPRKEDGTITADPRLYQHGLVLAYLIDWNLVDDHGEIVPIRGLSPADMESTLNALDEDDFAEIVRAIEIHVNEAAALQTEEKKPLAGVSA